MTDDEIEASHEAGSVLIGILQMAYQPEPCLDRLPHLAGVTLHYDDGSEVMHTFPKNDTTP